MFLAGLLLLIATDANSQERTVDFNSNPNVKVRFLPDGLAQEIPFKSLIQLKEGEKRYTLHAILPESGRFEVVMNHAGKIKLENVKTEADPDGKGYRGRAEFVVQIKRLSPEQALNQAEQVVLKLLSKQLQQARQERGKKKKNDIKSYLSQQRLPLPSDDAKLNDLYDKVRAAELGKDLLREKLQEFMEEHPQWFVKSDMEGVESLSGPVAMNDYRNLLALDIAEPYLREMGLTFETNRGNFREVISRHLHGIDAMLSGKSDKERDAGKRSLPQETREELLAAISLDASLRFYPATDESDPNSQWFHAQKVACMIRGIGTVRIEGRLDPGAADQSDWWVLSGLDRSKLDIEWPRQGVRYELFDEETDQVKLRLVATTDQAVDYVITFDTKSASKSTRKVVLVETDSRPDAKFPF